MLPIKDEVWEAEASLDESACRRSGIDGGTESSTGKRTMGRTAESKETDPEILETGGGERMLVSRGGMVGRSRGDVTGKLGGDAAR